MSLSKTLFATFAVACLSVPALAVPFNFNETTNGDLSGLSSTPTFLTAGIGSNFLSGAVGGSDADFFSFTVGAGQILTAIRLDSWSSSSNPQSNLTFMAYGDVSDGVAVSNPFDTSQWDGLGLFNSVSSLGKDILETEVPVGGLGFASSLGPGIYTFWLNETNGRDTYRLNFQIGAADPVDVSEPHLLALGLSLCGISMAMRRKSKRNGA
jgi:hypothetical protein